MLCFSAAADIHYLPGDSASVPQGKIVAVEARVAMHDGRIGSGKGAEWSLIWDDVEVTLRLDFRTFLDGVDSPSVEVTCAGLTARSEGFDTYGGFNTLAVEWGADGKAKVLGGQRELKPLLVVDSLPRPSRTIMVKGSAPTEVADLIVETDPNDFDRLLTDYSPAELAQAQHWLYLDRENEPALALPGGSYLLAQVGNDLIYLSGARTNASQWRTGMLKGTLTPTGYDGYYRLQWYDATGRRLPDESYAQFDPAAKTMTLVFPALQSRLRFAAQNEKAASSPAR